MRSRTRAAIVVLIVGIALWATQERWLPFLLQNTGFFEKNSGFLSGLEAFVNLVLLLFNAGTAYLIWVSKQKGDERERNTKFIVSSQSTPTTIPTERLLRSSIPNIGSTLDSGNGWIDNRLRESLDGLLWIDKDCGFDVENYIGLGLQIASTKVSSLYTVVKVNPVDDFLGLDSSKHSSKDSRFQEYKSKDIYDIFCKLTEPMVLLGYPGGGKSVTLRHLGQTLSILQKAKKNDNFVLPFYVHLGDYISIQENGLPKLFEDFIIDYICQVWNTPKEVVHEKFVELAQKGKIAFLLDSMDEMPRQDYVERYDEIRAFIRRYSLCRYVFACRHADYDERLRVSEIVVEPLNESQVNEYLHKFLSNNFGWSSSKINFTIQQINEDNPQLLEFFSNPFTLKLAGLYIGTSVEPPKSFASLYFRLVEQAWIQQQNNHDFQKKIDTGQIDYGEFLKIMSWLGYCMTINDGVGTAVELKSLSETAQKLGVEIYDQDLIKKYITISKQLKLLQIREFGNIQISFQHHKLQEYFTALFLAGKEKSLSGLLPKAGVLGGIWWQETMVLLAAISETPTDILNYLFDVASQGTQVHEAWGLDKDSARQILEGERIDLLARCFDVAREKLDESILRRIVEEISVTIPISDPIRRVYYSRALSRLKHPAAEKLLRKRLDDPSGWVREEAFSALLKSKSGMGPNRRFALRYLADSIREGKSIARGFAVAKVLFRQRQLLDIVPIAFLTTIIGYAIGFMTAIILLLSAYTLWKLGIPPVYVIIAALPFTYAAYKNAQIYRVVTLKAQFPSIGAILAFFVLLYFLLNEFRTIWILPVAWVILNLGILLFMRIIGGERAIDKFYETANSQIVSHTKLHEKMTVLGQKFRMNNSVLSSAFVDEFFDLYKIGCQHIHQDVVELLSEGRVDSSSYRRLRERASEIQNNDPFRDDIWQILHEKELQLRRQMASAPQKE